MALRFSECSAVIAVFASLLMFPPVIRVTCTSYWPADTADVRNQRSHRDANNLTDTIRVMGRGTRRGNSYCLCRMYTAVKARRSTYIPNTLESWRDWGPSLLNQPGSAGRASGVLLCSTSKYMTSGSTYDRCCRTSTSLTKKEPEIDIPAMDTIMVEKKAWPSTTYIAEGGELQNV